MNKHLFLGDEAIAQGALDAGLSGVYAYPGTPSTEITEYIQISPEAKNNTIHTRWCTNEKTAMEAALGMSYIGKRALVCMKHVGIDAFEASGKTMVDAARLMMSCTMPRASKAFPKEQIELLKAEAADAFINAGMTGVNGGLIVVAADDPSMHSSQNEQDSRFYGNFAFVPMFDFSNQKVVTNAAREILMISRSPIPYPKGTLDFEYEKVTGIQLYSRRALAFYHETPKSILEKAEENDMMRFVENGHKVHAIVSPYKTVSVDTPKDLALVSEILKGKE